MKIEILLATFNGQEFLERQLDSIRAQDWDNFMVLMSDDGSSDNTVSILKRYEELDSRFVFLSSIRKGGVIQNFDYLLRRSTAEAIFFADQDDIWERDKIRTMIVEAKMQKGEGWLTQPLMFYSDMSVIDERDVVVSDSFYSYIGYKEGWNRNLEVLACLSTVYGTSCMLTSELVRLVGHIPDCVCMHDHYLALIALYCDGLVFLDHRLTSYRIHKNNTIGAGRAGIVRKLLRVRDVIYKANAYLFKLKDQARVLDDWINTYEGSLGSEWEIRLDSSWYWIKNAARIRNDKSFLLLLCGIRVSIGRNR